MSTLIDHQGTIDTTDMRAPGWIHMDGTVLLPTDGAVAAPADHVAGSRAIGNSVETSTDIEVVPLGGVPLLPPHAAEQTTQNSTQEM